MKNSASPKWFANRGQIIQTGIALAALIMSGIVNGWPLMKNSEYFSGGAVLFYILVGLVVFSIGRLVLAIPQAFGFASRRRQGE